MLRLCSMSAHGGRQKPMVGSGSPLISECRSCTIKRPVHEFMAGAFWLDLTMRPNLA
jgi:hypothetical protein